MSNDSQGSGEQLVQWLKEAGRRTQSKSPEVSEDGDETYNSPTSLHRYVEVLAGRKLQEVLHYLREVAGSQPEWHRERELRRMVREVALLVMLAVSYLFYYYFEVQLQIAALQTVNVFIPAPEAKPLRKISS